MVTSWAVRVGALTSILLLSSVAGANEAPTQGPSMTLAEALAYARGHRPELRAVLARAEAAKAQADVTRSRWYPSLIGTAQLLATTTNNTTGSYLAVPTFDNARVSATKAESAATASLSPEPTTLAGISGRQEIFDFGQIAAQATADDLRAEAAGLDASSTKLIVDYDVEEAYFAAFAAGSVLSAADHARERALVHRDMAKAGVDAGLRRPIELTRAEAVLDRYELERIRARRGVTAAEVVFAAAVGYPTEILDAAGAPPETLVLAPIDTALARASERNPELRAALTRFRAQRQQTEAIAASGRPNVYLSATFSGNAGGSTPSSGVPVPGDGLAPIVPNWDVGLVVVWPLLDATISAREHVSRVTEDAVRDDADAVRLRLLASVTRAYADARSATEALPVLRRSVDAAVANYDQANARFTVGLGNSVELADAEDLRTGAEIDLALGRFELARSWALIQRLLAEGT
jgi:outer membrane protein